MRRIACLALALLFAVPAYAETPKWSLAIHGGAGVIDRGDLTPEKEAEYRLGLNEALIAGQDVLERGGSAVDAVEATVKVLEDNPLFNAGRGAVFAADGKNYLDASIMDGSTLKAGAVAGLTTTRHPVSAARSVMDTSRHVLLTGPGADQYAAEHGLEPVDPAFFRTEARWQAYLKWKASQGLSGVDDTHKYGTVGAVALDQNGHLAAATSTGGLTGKMWGRIGDSPLIGSGTIAIDGQCAVSGTGTGEYFIRQNAARQVCDRVHWNDETIQSAADNTIAEIGRIGGDGGLISMDKDGKVAFALNVSGMYRGTVSSQSPAKTAIYADENP